MEYYDLALNLEKVLIRPIPAGTYYIAVEPSDLTQQGNYSFGSDFYSSNEIAGDDYGNTIATATVLNAAITVTGELSDVHDTDFFKIDVQQNVFLI